MKNKEIKTTLSKYKDDIKESIQRAINQIKTDTGFYVTKINIELYNHKSNCITNETLVLSVYIDVEEGLIDD